MMANAKIWRRGKNPRSWLKVGASRGLTIGRSITSVTSSRSFASSCARVRWRWRLLWRHHQWRAGGWAGRCRAGWTKPRPDGAKVTIRGAPLVVQLCATALRGAEGSSAAVRDPKGGSKVPLTRVSWKFSTKCSPAISEWLEGTPTITRVWAPSMVTRASWRAPVWSPGTPGGSRGLLRASRGSTSTRQGLLQPGGRGSAGGQGSGREEKCHRKCFAKSWCLQGCTDEGIFLKFLKVSKRILPDIGCFWIYLRNCQEDNVLFWKHLTNKSLLTVKMASGKESMNSAICRSFATHRRVSKLSNSVVDQLQFKWSLNIGEKFPPRDLLMVAYFPLISLLAFPPFNEETFLDKFQHCLDISQSFLWWHRSNHLGENNE